jgi:two-component system, OmpR family, sensor histidine kinase KdpD
MASLPNFHPNRRRLLILCGGFAGVAAVTYSLTVLVAANSSTAGFFYLLVVLAVATTGGFRVAAPVSVVAMLSYNYCFLPPVGRFTIADPENWVALFTFLLTSLVASHLSDRAQREAADARNRQRETEQLYSLSRAILMTEAGRSIGPQAAQSIAQIFESPSVAILDAKTNRLFRGGERDIDGVEVRLQDVVRLGNAQQDPALDLQIWPISLGGNPMGALATVGMRSGDGAVQSMLNLVAIALERVRTEEAANRAEVARQSEEFKSTLLDAIAHEFKTPLTSIKAAATGLQTTDLPSAERGILIEIVVEEADRMSQLVTEAVKMAEIDAGKVKPNRARVRASELVRAAKAGFEGRGGERVRLEDPAAADDEILADADLMSLALRQILDNALKYAPSGPILCTVDAGIDRVRIRIQDSGPGIPMRERDRIFEKFYRRAGSRELVPGTGLGLHIARELARIHGGDLFVEDSTAAPGATFCFDMPRALESAGA